MFGSDILDVVIGLVFVYLLFSLICTTLTEAIARLFAMRSGTLEAAIRNMLEQFVEKTDANTGKKETKNISKVDIDKFYTNPFVKSLAKKGGGGLIGKIRFRNGNKWKRARPSYIPSRTFALVLFDTIRAAQPAAPPIAPNNDNDNVDVNELLKTSTDDHIRGMRKYVVDEMPAGLPLKKQMLTLLNTDNDATIEVQAKAKGVFKGMRETVETLRGADEAEQSDLYKSLTQILDSAESEAKSWDEAVAKARIGVEKWFDDVMDRVTGWYARSTRTVVITLACIVTILFNVDSLAIVNALQNEPTLRAAAVAQATEFAANNPDIGDRAEPAAEDAGAMANAEDAAPETAADAAAPDPEENEDSTVGAEETDAAASVDADEYAAEDVDMTDAADGMEEIAPEAAADTGGSEDNADAPPKADDGLDLDALQKEVDRLGFPIGWVIVVEGIPPISPEDGDSELDKENLWTVAMSQTLEVSAQQLWTWGKQPAASTIQGAIIMIASSAGTELYTAHPDHAEELDKALRYRQVWPRNAGDWVMKILGLALTIVALSLGAPFWFEALNKLVNMRAAGNAPARADTPPSAQKSA